jgi:hypothetical protein
VPRPRDRHERVGSRPVIPFACVTDTVWSTDDPVAYVLREILLLVAGEAWKRGE